MHWYSAVVETFIAPGRKCGECGAPMQYAVPDERKNPALAGPAGPHLVCTACGHPERTGTAARE